MSTITDNAKVHVIGPSQVDPVSQAVEMDATEFYELLYHAIDLEERLKDSRQLCLSLAAVIFLLLVFL